jgi:hypothetical protein
MHRLVHYALAAVIVAGLGLGALAWRLAEGPMDVPFLARRIEAQFNRAGPTRLEIGTARVSWGGWREGHLSPLEFLIEDVRVVDPTGSVRAAMPSAEVSLSLPWLLRGQIAPRIIELRRPVLRVFRAQDGTLALDLGSLTEKAVAETPPEVPAAVVPAPAEEPAGGAFAARLFVDLMRPPSDATPMSALERVEVDGGLLLVVDRQLDRVWWLQEPQIALHRRPEGGVRGEGSALLQLAGERVPVRLTGAAGGDPARVEVGIVLPMVRPGALARAVPALNALGMLDATVAASAGVTLDTTDWRPVASRAALRAAGPGAIDLGEGRRIGFTEFEANLVGEDGTVRLERAVLRLGAPPAAAPPASPPPNAAARAARRPADSRPPQPPGAAAVAPQRASAPPPTLTAEAEARRADGRWRAVATLALDAVAFADLEAYWPPGIAEGARAWMVRNITAGTARNGRWRIEAEAPETALDALSVTALSGSAEASGATVHWLRPIPPVEGAEATAEFGLSEITLRTRGGRQQGTRFEAREGTLRFAGFDSGPGEAELHLRLAGPVQDLWAVLKHPRLRLLDRRRVDIGDPSGMLDSRLSLAFPLLADLPVEDLRVRAQARMTELRVPGVLLGHDLEHGAVEASVDNDGLQVAGTGQLAEIPARLDVRMDFRAGPASQVIGRESISARAEARQLAALGLDLGDVLEGPVAIEARHETRRNGQGRANVRADLREARLHLDPLGWSKPPGAAGVAEANLALRSGALVAVENARLEADDLNLRARATVFRDGRPERIEVLDSFIAASRFSGEVHPPARDGAEWQVALRGPVLDLRQAFAPDRTAAVAQPPPQRRDGGGGQEPPGGPALALDARFDRVLLGQRRELRALDARARVDTRGVLRAAEAQARTAEGSGGRVAFALAPQADGRRHLSLTAEDAGALLRAVDLVGSIQGGRLSVDAAYDEPRPGATLSGTADMTEFAVRDAPAIGKLLQAMTLYGLVDAMRGPGLGFARLIAPFSLSPDLLVLGEARAYSASLGLTAKGRIDRRRNTVDMEGTIVPAYVFNSLLGNIPIFGRLFSPETGGGLFAASYRVQGPLGDPQVMVNPLTALTPGFLRGLFGVFEQGQR